MEKKDPNAQETEVIEFIEKTIRTRGKILDSFDAAAALLGFTVGFAADLVIFTHSGIPPATMGGLGSAAAVGVEQGIKGWLHTRSHRREADQQFVLAQRKILEQERQSEVKQAKLHRKLANKAEALEEFLTDTGDKSIHEEFKLNHSLWAAEIIDDEQFNEKLQQIINKLLSYDSKQQVEEKAQEIYGRRAKREL